MTPPTVADVDRIAGLGDPILRNLQITQCYFELSTRVAERTGGGANWCTFATWASKQAGQTIRKQDLGRALQRALTQPPALNDLAPAMAPAGPHAAAEAAAEARVDESIWEILDPTAPFDRASTAVAQGNRKVFAEIGRVFAAFAGDCLDDTQQDEANIAAFCATLRPGPPPDGQEYLRQAFASYYAALFAADPQARAERLLFANVAIGLHEQTRLQPEIVEALDAPVVDPRDLTRRLLAVLSPYPSWVMAPWALLRRLLGRPLLAEIAAERTVVRLRELARRIVTDHLMTLALPGGVYLRLGHDLRASYPISLQHIVAPDLQALLAGVDPTPDSVADTGAVDWGDLGERLHFIADMFRCYQETPLLLEPPFTPVQVAALQAGRVPPGEL